MGGEYDHRGEQGGRGRRIRGGREIREFLSDGRWVRGETLDICYRPSCILRSAVLIRRGVGRGVRRARGKRLAREVWRRRCRDVVGEWEVGIVVKKMPAGFWGLWSELDGAMRKVGLISEGRRARVRKSQSGSP